MGNVENNQVNNQDNTAAQTADIFTLSNVVDIIYILIFIILIGLTYQYNPLKIFTNNMLTSIRIKYMTIMFLYLALIFVMYYYDFLHLSSNYFSILTLTSLIIGCFLFAIILYYVVTFSKSDIYQSVPQAPTIVINGFKIAIGWSLSIIFVLFLVTMIYSPSNSSSTLSMILNIFIILGLLTLMYKILSKSSILQSSPWFRFIVNTLLYIPCLLAGTIDAIITQYNTERARTTKSDLIWMVIGILLITIYYVVPYLIGWIQSIYQGGKMLVNESLVLNDPYNIAGYIALNDIDAKDPEPVYEYNYAISLWLYIDAIAPNKSAAYGKFTPVFSYGGKPTISYNASSNTMIVTAKIKDVEDKILEDTNMEKDENGDVIIYKLENILLQKWNHILINYSGGILDIFYNGELVKSAKNIVPYMELDTMTIGSSDGINGAICNVVYYKHTLDANSISYLYNSAKNSTPPTSSYAPSNKQLIKKNLDSTM